MRSSDRLQQYQKKRNFSRTTEPRGTPLPAQSSTELLYVVQKHAARRLHYDFRLELDGTLKSWAVPKGPSLNPSDKRLAVHVEDHPMEYADFEGTIPPRQYGAGSVMVWDQGHWIPDGNPKEAYKKGRLKFTLTGHKLNGRWTLVRMNGARNQDGTNWLLIKERDDAAGTTTLTDSLLTASRSVKSGRSMKEIADTEPDVRHSPRKARRGTRAISAEERTTESPVRVHLKTSLRRRGTLACPEWLQPQLATLVDEIPQGDDWIYELKYDGYRMLCRIERGNVRLLSRNGRDWTTRLPMQAAAAAPLRMDNGWLDGELVAIHPDGSMSFQTLQNSLDHGRNVRLVYVVFDLLFLNGVDFREFPLHERKRQLAQLLTGQPDEGPLRYSNHLRGEGLSVFEEVCRQGLEGLIAKHVDGRYLAGRNTNWVKVKCRRRQEFVIGGFTDPSGSRRGFGALLLGVYEDSERFVYVGRVGTGFSDERLSELHRKLRQHVRLQPAFDEPPQGSETKGVHWVNPVLVAEVRFAEWTEEGLLRQASFLGLREDKPARTIVRESTASMTASERATGPPKAPATRRPSRPISRARRTESVHRTPKSTGTATVAGITISNPYRLLFPHDGITKLDLARYYEHIAHFILPHIQGRPLTLLRCPDGHETGCFYQKHGTDQIHEAIDQIEVEESNGPASYMTANTPAALVALVQLGVLEFHTWGSQQDRLDCPNRITLDLDPAPNVPWQEVVEAAFLIRTLLTELHLTSFVKTTGGKGLHVVAPLKGEHSWDDVKHFAKSIAHHMARTIPARFTDNMSKQARKGKVYLDYLRNSRGATAVAAYSTRAKPRAPLSLPIAWDELTSALHSDQFTVHNIDERLSILRNIDPWSAYLEVNQHLTKDIIMRLTRKHPPHGGF